MATFDGFCILLAFAFHIESVVATNFPFYLFLFLNSSDNITLGISWLHMIQIHYFVFIQVHHCKTISSILQSFPWATNGMNGCRIIILIEVDVVILLVVLYCRCNYYYFYSMYDFQFRPKILNLVVVNLLHPQYH